MLFRLKAICNKRACTCFFDRWFGVDISPVCRKHDRDYALQNTSKELADARLFKGIVATVPWYKGNYILATFMWLGVRAGGYATSWNAIKKER